MIRNQIIFLEAWAVGMAMDEDGTIVLRIPVATSPNERQIRELKTVSKVWSVCVWRGSLKKASRCVALNDIVWLLSKETRILPSSGQAGRCEGLGMDPDYSRLQSQGEVRQEEVVPAADDNTPGRELKARDLAICDSGHEPVVR